jgi:hypothetical protein
MMVQKVHGEITKRGGMIIKTTLYSQSGEVECKIPYYLTSFPLKKKVSH